MSLRHTANESVCDWAGILPRRSQEVANEVGASCARDAVVSRAGVVLVAFAMALCGCNGQGEEAEESWAFSETEARRRQEQTATRLGIAVGLTLSVDVSTQIGMVLIPEGNFYMGSPESETEREDNEGLHHVILSRPFYLSRTEVTQRQWKAVERSEPWSVSGQAKNGGDYPVSCVSWDAAARFCAKLSRLTGRVCRLPTEAEWEYACRAGANGAFYYGNDSRRTQLRKYAWYASNAGSAGEEYPHEVAGKVPNVWGLFDMHGNVEEWCDDKKRLHSGSAGRFEYAATRGGSWVDIGGYCRCAYRSMCLSAQGSPKIGFRILVEVPKN